MGKKARRHLNLKDEVIRAFRELPGSYVVDGTDIGNQSGRHQGKPKLLAPTKWVSEQDMDWAEEVGIFVRLTDGESGDDEREGAFTLSPEISRNIGQQLPPKETRNARDVNMVILKSLVKWKPEFNSEELVRAFAIVSVFFESQELPSPK